MNHNNTPVVIVTHNSIFVEATDKTIIIKNEHIESITVNEIQKGLLI